MSHNLVNAIDELASSCFLEFLQDDLPKVIKENKNTGGLLGQDEKKGFERLIEAFQCNMWSNMQQVKQQQIDSGLKLTMATLTDGNLHLESDQNLEKENRKQQKSEEVKTEEKHKDPGCWISG